MMHGPINIRSNHYFALLLSCVKMFHSQCYLVATVIHIHSLHSQICMYVCMHVCVCVCVRAYKGKVHLRTVHEGPEGE